MTRFLLPMVFLVAGCGAKGPLQYPDGTPPAAPIGTETPPTSAEMLKPPPQAAPDRVDDPVRRSEDRGEDRFDVPPSEG